MADFTPFAGLRYDTEKVRLDEVLAPPYDVIDSEQRSELLARSEYNVVEVELPVGEDDTKYERAAAALNTWRENGILTQDEPAFYIYEQEFRVPGTGQTLKRRGVLGALLLEEFGTGVQPHEFTLSGPKQDRLKLLRATGTNTSPIFGLFEDKDAWTAQLLERLSQESQPDGEARDHEGVLHRIWKVVDEDVVNAITDALDAEAILIADGHHRYETALNYRNERAAAAGDDWRGTEPENYVMMMCVSMQDPGLIILPTHRLIKNVALETVAALPDTLQKYFHVEKIPGEANDLLGKVNEGETIRIGLIVPGAQYLLTLREGQSHLPELEAGRSQAYNDLDVTILHRLILERELSIGAAELAAGEHVDYNIDVVESSEKVESKEYEAAFILRPTRIEQVSECCASGDKMPQKSTYFYPKLITGLVLRPMA